MKNLLLMTTAAVALAGAAQAEVEFVKGEASLTYSQIAGETFSILDGTVGAAFSMGTYGFQFGGTTTTFTDFADSITFSSVDAHAYSQGANGNKYGVYTSSGSVFLPAMSYGVEGMFNLGLVDVEAFAGLIAFSGNEIGQAGVAAFAEVSNGFEVSAAYETIFEIGGLFSEDYYELGASYDIPNSNLEATATYQSFFGGTEAIYGVGIQWNFGPNQDERLFGDRSFPIFFF